MTELAVVDGGLGEYWQIPDAKLDGVWFVDMSSVNIEDLVRSSPGSIVRCRHLPAVQYVPPPMYFYEHVAGLISDAA